MTLKRSILPKRIPIFPLAGVLLLPRCELPLNIFEPRYIEMLQDSLVGDRIIGIIQPLKSGSSDGVPELHSVGGAGHISSFNETEDGRYVITLTGASRFNVLEELEVDTSYRQVIVDWTDYYLDLSETEKDSGVDRDKLLPILKHYLQFAGLDSDWAAIQKMPSGELVDNLSMICPFDITEKQALLESSDVAERSNIVISLLEMSTAQSVVGYVHSNKEQMH